MSAFVGYNTKAQFHYDYLREMLSEQGLTYSKNTTGPVSEKHYLDALTERHDNTGHIASFGELLAVFSKLEEADASH